MSALEGAKRHPQRVDLAIATVLGAFNVLALFAPRDYLEIDFRDADALGVGLTLASCAAVALRGRWPVPAFAVATAGSLAVLALGYPQAFGGVAALFTLYTVAARCSLRTSIASGLAAWGVLFGVLIFGPFELVVADWFGNTLVLTTGWALGRAVRAQRERVAGLEERNLALEAARESQTRAALTEERNRIAREMHDIVAHSLTAMTVQAAAARRLVRRDPDSAEHVLDAVQGAGRSALDELRRVLGVLDPKDGDDALPLQPQPGLADLPELVERVRATGLDVSLEQEGEAVPLDAGVALAAYRIVQESLTNALKHAGPAHVVVRLTWWPGRLDISVEDDGRGALTGDAPLGTGRGLTLLRERAEVYGGSVSAGPRTGGGYALSATLPTAGRRP